MGCSRGVCAIFGQGVSDLALHLCIAFGRQGIAQDAPGSFAPDTSERPGHMAADQGLGVAQGLCQRRYGTRVVQVSQRHGHIAE